MKIKNFIFSLNMLLTRMIDKSEKKKSNKFRNKFLGILLSQEKHDLHLLGVVACQIVCK